MRYMLKGGVWKNAEDEILKAAVMKYGLNQWSRISSLLVRKSAKQCKSRWYEWLDPSIKKTEWTREEEEKLLHLVKIFPCQWRTIAPIVGRTPAQCVEHYDKLLDKAQGKEELDENDPRKLKPGEIDPNPETRGAIPDQIDMDEDMKEMLAEAMVRLANTKGKKAKRKAREKQIEEARRLAQLQKQRELKAAGIDILVTKKVKGGMNYNEEVPFERKAPNFVFNPGSEENPKPNLNLANISLQTLEGTKRDEEKEKFNKIDQKRIKKLKERDLPTAIDKITNLNSTIFNSTTKLVLPSPQLLDKDLEMIGKLNSMQNLTESQNAATKALIGNYSQREVTPTPLRTPRNQDSLMRKANDLINLRNIETPLMGGANPSMRNVDFSGSGLTPNTKIPSTPNPFNKAQTGNQTVNKNQTPLRNPSDISLKQTPLHDEFKLNNEEPLDKNWELGSHSNVGNLSQAKLERLKANQQRWNLKKSLDSLPKPKNNFQIEIPEIDENRDEDEYDEYSENRIIDAEELDNQKKRKRIMELDKKLKERTLVVQKNLPRPTIVNTTFHEFINENPLVNGIRKTAEDMLNNEIITLLSNDSIKHPFPGCKQNRQFCNFESFKKKDLSRASELINQEIQEIKKELRHSEISNEVFSENWNKIEENIIYDPKKSNFNQLAQMNRSEKLSSLQWNFEMKREQYLNELKNIETLEKRVNILLGGYSKRINTFQRELENFVEHSNQQNIELEVFKILRVQEKIAFNERMNEMENFYSLLVAKENSLQIKYANLLVDREDMLKSEDELFQK